MLRKNYCLFLVAKFMFIVPCIVIQLCNFNHFNVNQTACINHENTHIILYIQYTLPPDERMMFGSGVPRNFVRGGRLCSTNSVEDRERGSGGGSPLVGGFGTSCNLVKGISFHILKFS